MAKRIGFISDLHANLRLPFARVDEGGISSDRLRDVADILRQTGVECRASGIEDLYILGDLFDQKHPDGATLVSTSQVLRELADSGVRVNILPGNHDAVDRDGRLYTLQFYEALKVPGIKVLGHEAIEIQPGLCLQALPWLPDSRALRRMREMDKGGPNDRNILLFHQSVVGAVGDSGWECDDGLPSDAHDGFDFALSGHYHMPQKHDWGIYLGSPLQMKFSDDNVDKRGFWSMDVTAKILKPKLHPLSSPLFGTDTVQLDKGDLIEDLVDIEESAEGLQYLRLIVEGDASAIARAQRTLLHWKGEADKYGLRCLKVDARPEKVLNADRMKVNPSLSPATIAREYAKKEGLDAAKVKVGIDILNEVMR